LTTSGSFDLVSEGAQAWQVIACDKELVGGIVKGAQYSDGGGAGDLLLLASGERHVLHLGDRVDGCLDESGG
jgi:hypothetical protein